MKFLLIVRHAKSSWDPAISVDFDRTLNERGRKDAPEMAERLKARQITPDILISSPAKRARKTARLFAEIFNIGKEEIELVDKLYEPALSAFFQTVSSINDDNKTAAIFSHNPGITDFVNSLTDTRIDDMPTCGVFGVKVHTDRWSEFNDADKDFWFFDCPKMGD